MLGTLLSRKAATLKELETYYSAEDVFDMLEVIIVDEYNAALANKD